MKKMLIITPHLSTGGAPQVTVNKISLLKDTYSILVVEYSCLSPTFIVQKNRIIDLIGRENLITLDSDKNNLINIINSFSPDFISVEEYPEFFMDDSIARYIYDINRTYKIFESTHDSSFDISKKRFFPDKFIFVTPYNVFKAINLDTPYEVIEYPVDFKESDSLLYKKKLNLDLDYKHIVNIGLFTPRKNQKYLFELANRLKDYKIKFHFLGNQADNFSFYWQPLMDMKTSDPASYGDCIVWGERADTDDFIQASDLFVFTSKGDRNNKELNPIVIKEALQYKMPMMMFNLDVYCGKYNEYSNINWLTGNIEDDANSILSVLKPNKKVNDDEIVIIGTYPNTKERVKLTIDCINSFKACGRKIMLVSHYPVSDDIQRMVDFYVFDKHNPLTYHSYFQRFYNYQHDYDVEIMINGLKNTNQSLTVLTNLYNGFKFSKNLNFKKAIYVTYDVVLNELDLPKIEEIYSNLYRYNAQLAYNHNAVGKGIETTCMGFDIDFFLKTFDDVRNEDDYNKICSEINAQNFLEDYMKKAADMFHENNYLYEDNQPQTLLKNSGLGVSSNSEYYSILPVTGKPNTYIVYFYTYNIDHRRVNIIIRESDNEIYNNSFIISKQREFKQMFTFNGKPIEIELCFFDGEDLYKKEVYTLNNLNIDKYNKTGYFKPKLKPKVKLVHLQTTRNDEREQISRQSLEKVKDFGIDYCLHKNLPYIDLPPKHNCFRPQCVSEKLFNDEDVHKYGTALTPAHYGCFESFKNAILSEFDDADFLIVCEGDCLIEVDTADFVNKVYKVAELITGTNIGYFSFGDTKTLDNGWHQSNNIGTIPNQDLFFITDKIIGLQCIMFPKSAKSFLKDSLRNKKWDAADIYFNTIFTSSQYQMAILNQRITTQADGLSLIDNEVKTFRK